MLLHGGHNTMLTIHTPKGVIRTEADTGKTLLSVLHDNGVFVDAPCGGNGTCGKCRVYVSGAVSPVTREERLRLTEAELASGLRLACRTFAQGDALVRLPEARAMEVETEGTGEQIEFCPAVRRYPLEVPSGSLDEQTDDMTRVLRALGERTGASASDENGGQVRFTPTLNALRRAPALLRSLDGKADAIVFRGKLLDLAAPGDPMLGMAVDIGTTTVAAYFYDLSDGAQLGVRSAMNPQRAFGADVISRIAASENGGLADEQRAITELLSGFARSFCAEQETSPERLYHITIAANTTMLHLLAGIDPKNIAAAPFLPASRFGFELRAEELGLAACPDAPVTLLPCVSAYVGADITAGMAAVGLDRPTEKTLYIDIGTNGEMAYADAERIVCCATAAGPAFEGAHIECGSGGVPGAIRGAVVGDGEIRLETIGGGKPTGICGSGLIDLVAALLEIEALDETGRLADEDELEPPYDACINDDGDFVLDAETGIRITAKDIREVQLAKAAIRAGICTLLDTVGETADTLDRLVVAGGFGAHIRPESACAIGLFPPQALSKYKTAGNAAGRGAVLALLNENAAGRMDSLARRCEYLELSGSQVFQDHYIEQMMFSEDE